MNIWHSDDDEEVLAEYLAEHAYSAGFDGDTFVIGVGDADRLPSLPEESMCAVCNTPLRNRGGVGWVHEVGFNQRGGCTVAFPGA